MSALGQRFDTLAEAAAFRLGIEWVNDPSITTGEPEKGENRKGTYWFVPVIDRDTENVGPDGEPIL